jgi:hypothetical protein
VFCPSARFLSLSKRPLTGVSAGALPLTECHLRQDRRVFPALRSDQSDQSAHGICDLSETSQRGLQTSLDSRVFGLWGWQQRVISVLSCMSMILHGLSDFYGNIALAGCVGKPALNRCNRELSAYTEPEIVLWRRPVLTHRGISRGRSTQRILAAPTEQRHVLESDNILAASTVLVLLISG